MTVRRMNYMPSWMLADADEVAAANKYTFFKSPRETIALVRPGEIVKLLFIFDSDDPDAPRAGGAQADDGAGWIGARGLLQPGGGRGRPASRLQVLNLWAGAGGRRSPAVVYK